MTIYILYGYDNIRLLILTKHANKLFPFEYYSEKRNSQKYS